MMLSHRIRKQAGFTLLEVLIATVLFSFILIMLYSSLFSTGHHWRASEIHTRQNDNKRLILSFIRRVIEQTSPMFQRDAQGSRLLFQGDDSSLIFVTHLPAHHAGSGIYFLKFEAEDDELLLRYTPLTRDKAMFEDDIFVEAEAINLLTQIKGINLDYFGQDASNAAPAWYDEWNNEARLPELIRFQIITDPDNPWPELLIALRSQGVLGQPPLTLPREEGDVRS